MFSIYCLEVHVQSGGGSMFHLRYQKPMDGKFGSTLPFLICFINKADASFGFSSTYGAYHLPPSHCCQSSKDSCRYSLTSNRIVSGRALTFTSTTLI